MMTYPLIIAHRGASGDAPENTLKAFHLAHQQGADGIELDIFLSRDGELVVTHDENLKRLTGQNLKTRHLPLTELKKLDFGQGEKIPTLKEVFHQFGALFSKINVEIKSTGYFTDGIEKKLIEMIKIFKLEDRILISSFNFLHLLRMKKRAPHLNRGFLIHPPKRWARHPWLIGLCKPTSFNLPHAWCTGKKLKEYQAKAPQIWLWTVNEERDMQFWIEKSITAIITNYPGRLKKVIENAKRSFVKS